MKKQKMEQNKTGKNGLARITYVSLLSAIIGFSLMKCSVDDPKIVSFEKAKVVNVSIPDTLVRGETYSFPVSFQRPTSCHDFDEFNVEDDIDEIFVSVVLRFEDNFDCESSNVPLGEIMFDHTVDQNNDFTFKFFQQTESNQILYLNKDVVVVESE